MSTKRIVAVLAVIATLLVGGLMVASKGAESNAAILGKALFGE